MSGGIAKPKQKNSVIGMFRRESSTSGNLPTASDIDSSTTQAVTPVVLRERNKRSASISGTGIYDVEAGGHAGQFPVTASHRRNTRKGSLLELSGYVSYLCQSLNGFPINNKGKNMFLTFIEMFLYEQAYNFTVYVLCTVFLKLNQNK